VKPGSGYSNRSALLLSISLYKIAIIVLACPLLFLLLKVDLGIASMAGASMLLLLGAVQHSW
jgi:hypothetical protein